MPGTKAATEDAPKAPAGTQAIQRASQIIKQIARAGPRGTCIAELSRALALERPTLHRMLLCLKSEGLVGRNPRTRRYHLGRALYDLGQAAAPRHGLRELSAPSLTRIAEHTGQTVFLAGLDGADGLVLDRRDGPASIRAMPLQIGMRRPLGVGATGLAMLMTMADAEIDRYLAENGRRLRDHDVSPARLPASLRKFRERGYATSRGYGTPQIYGLGVPLRGADGRICGAISVTALSSAIRPQFRREMATALCREALQIDLRLRSA